MAFWRTKAAISLKRVKIEEKLLWGPIGTHERSFERYHSRTPMASPSSKLGVCKLATPLHSTKALQLKSDSKKMKTVISLLMQEDYTILIT